MMALSRVSAPIVTILNKSASVVVRLLRIRPSEEPLVTEEEIKVIMEQGAEAGLIEEAEHETVRRLFRLSDRAVMALMIPRHDIVWLDADAPTEQTMKQVVASSHSRFPVARSSLDDVVGMVKEKDLLACCMGGRPLNLVDAAQPPLFVPGAIPAFRLLELFKKSRTHIALVVDEYGDVEGLVTINDFFEDLVGEVAAADMPQERRAVRRADGSWLIDGKMPVHDFKELLNLGKLPGEDRGSYLTLGGFVMMQIGRIPVSADSFEAEGIRFEVVDMDGKRVDKVLVQPLRHASGRARNGAALVTVRWHAASDLLLGTSGTTCELRGLSVPQEIPQISRAYSLIVRSLENLPIRATFRMAFAAHVEGWLNTAATWCCVSMYAGRSAR